MGDSVTHMLCTGHGDLDALLKREAQGSLPEARCRTIFGQVSSGS